MRHVSLPLLTAVLLAGCGSSSGRHASGVSAACAAIVVRDGVTYYGERAADPPEADASAGTGVIPPCQDTTPASSESEQRVALLRVHGVDPAVAVLVPDRPGVVYRARR